MTRLERLVQIACAACIVLALVAVVRADLVLAIVTLALMLVLVIVAAVLLSRTTEERYEPRDDDKT